MKTTIDLPDPLFREAKIYAASHGLSLKTLFTKAIEDRLQKSPSSLAEKLSNLPTLPPDTLQSITERIAQADENDLRLQKNTTS